MVGRPVLSDAVRIAKMHEEAETLRLQMKLDQETLHDLLASDMETKLLMIAVGGTAMSSLLLAYSSWKQARQEADDAAKNGAEPPKRRKDVWAYLSGAVDEYYDHTIGGWVKLAEKGAGMGLFGLGGYALKDHFDQEKLKATVDFNNPYSAINVMTNAAITATGLAWALLFLHALMGEGGLGGALEKVGGGGGALAAIGAGV